MATKKKTSQKKKPVKKIVSKPIKQTKALASKPEFEKAWKEYNDALNIWKESLAQWQKATNDTLMTYHDACQRALESDTELLKKVSSSWENTWQEIGPEYIKQQTKMIENIFKETNIDAIKKFNEQWEKFLKTSGDDSIKSYQEAIKQFNQAWQTNHE
jgi:hemerythrin-like domain-containing protein